MLLEKVNYADEVSAAQELQENILIQGRRTEHVAMNLTCLGTAAATIWNTYINRVATPRALVYNSLMTSGDAKSWYMISDDAKSFRQTHLVNTNTQSDLEEAPLKVEEFQLLVSRAPLTDEEFEVLEPSDTRITSLHSSAYRIPPHHSRIVKAAALSLSSFRKRYKSYYKTPSPSSSPTLPIRKRYQGTSEIILDTETEDESSDSDAKRDCLEDEGNGLEDHGLGSDEVGHGLEDEGPGLEEQEEEAAPEGQQHVVLVVDTAIDEPLGLRYRALRCHELALGEGLVPNTFEVDKALDEDQFLELHESIVHDHMQCLDALPPTLFEGYDRDLRELYTRENHDLRRHIAKERRKQLELIDHVARMKRRHESGWE
nr:hypothetical protein [Tanacetum cinerariifolium]